MKRWKLILLLLVLGAGLAIGAGVSMLHNGLSAHATPTAIEALLARNARTWRFRRMPATSTNPSRRPIRIFKKQWCTSRITAHRATRTTAAAILCTAEAYTR